MIVNQSDKEKIFDHIQHYADHELSTSRIDVVELLRIKKEFFSLVIDFIETKEIFKMVREHFKNRDYNYFFGKSLRMHDGYMLYIKSENEELAKIVFNTDNIKDVFNSLKDIDTKNDSFEVNFSTELKGVNDIKSICFEMILNQNAEEIKSNSIYLKNKEKTNKLFTLKDYFENKNDVLEHLKLNDY